YLPSPSFTLSFNPPPPSGISTLSLHDALPIWLAGADHRSRRSRAREPQDRVEARADRRRARRAPLRLARRQAREVERDRADDARSEEHTSELQSRVDLVCRLLLEKKKQKRREQ